MLLIQLLTYLPKTCSIDCISIVVRFSDYLRTPAVVHLLKEQSPAFILPSHALSVEGLQTPPARQIPHVLCGPSFSSHGPETGQPETIFHRFKKCLWIKGVPAMALWWWQGGKKRNVEPRTALVSLVDWFSWGHQVLGNNFLSAVPYRGIRYHRFYLSMTTSLTFCLWTKLMYTLYRPVFPLQFMAGGFVLISQNQGYVFYQTFPVLVLLVWASPSIAFPIAMRWVDSLIDKKWIDQFW